MPLNRLWLSFLLGTITANPAALAQDTIALSDVEIITDRRIFSQTGKKTERTDSLVKAQFRSGSVAELLAYSSPVFIKRYGPGGIATTSFRGGNAAQTAVVWNGLNLQNAMLGETDLSLLPSVLFDNVEIEYGGSSSAWGSGAMAGSIHLNNKARFGEGANFLVNAFRGSFGLNNVSGKLQFSNRRLASRTVFYATDSRNDFRYYGTQAGHRIDQRQQHAGYHFRGILQEIRFTAGRHLFSANAWLNDYNRRVPGFAGTESKTYQYDAAQRFSFSWQFEKRRWAVMTRAGFFAERLDYTDSLATLFAKSKIRTSTVENDSYFGWRDNQRLHIGVSASSNEAVTEDYGGSRSLSRASLTAGNKSYFFDRKVAVIGTVRLEGFSTGATPVTGNVSSEYEPVKGLTLLANLAKIYRHPTLNQLYWIPGGNTSLLPEQGYAAEGSASYERKIRRCEFSVSGAGYSRMIDNWMLWVPGGSGFPRAANVQKVWSRGTEMNLKLVFAGKKIGAGGGILTGYVLSTVEKDRQENSAATGKQLIYTPRYTANGQLYVMYRNASLIFFQHYTGYRFTASDHSQWLEPFYVSSVRLNYKARIRSLSVVLYAACNNLFDADYQVMEGRPMPLRNYESGLTISIHKPIKPTNHEN